MKMLNSNRSKRVPQAKIERKFSHLKANENKFNSIIDFTMEDETKESSLGTVEEGNIRERIGMRPAPAATREIPLR